MDGKAGIEVEKGRVRKMKGRYGSLHRQIKGVHKDLLTFQARTEQRFDELTGKVEGRFAKVEGRHDRVESEVRGLRKDMPGIVGDAMRATLRRGKSRKTP